MKTKHLKLAVTIAVFGFLSSSKMSAQNEQRKRPSNDEIMEHMDTNEDGKLSKKEVKGPLKKDFATIDSNEDGFISKEELEKAPKPKRGPKREK